MCHELTFVDEPTICTYLSLTQTLVLGWVGAWGSEKTKHISSTGKWVREQGTIEGTDKRCPGGTAVQGCAVSGFMLAA